VSVMTEGAAKIKWKSGLGRLQSCWEREVARRGVAVVAVVVVVVVAVVVVAAAVVVVAFAFAFALAAAPVAAGSAACPFAPAACAAAVRADSLQPWRTPWEEGEEKTHLGAPPPLLHLHPTQEAAGEHQNPDHSDPSLQCAPSCRPGPASSERRDCREDGPPPTSHSFSPRLALAQQCQQSPSPRTRSCTSRRCCPAAPSALPARSAIPRKDRSPETFGSQASPRP